MRGRESQHKAAVRPMANPLRRVIYGATTAVVTSMAVIVGLNLATAGRSAVVASLLIIALADNLTDSLGVHVYQEAERLAQRDAFRTTVTNFAARLGVSLSFVAIVVLLRWSVATLTALIWGLSLLCFLSYWLARTRRANPVSEILKHCAVATVVVVLSAAIGLWLKG